MVFSTQELYPFFFFAMYSSYVSAHNVLTTGQQQFQFKKLFVTLVCKSNRLNIVRRSKGNTVTNNFRGFLYVNIQDCLLVVDIESSFCNPVILWGLSIYLASVLYACSQGRLFQSVL